MGGLHSHNPPGDFGRWDDDCRHPDPAKILVFLVGGRMDASSIKLLAAAISVLLVTLASLGIGYIGGKTNEAIARNPETARLAQTNMFIAMAFCEGLGVLVIVVALLILFLFK